MVPVQQIRDNSRGYLHKSGIWVCCNSFSLHCSLPPTIPCPFPIPGVNFTRRGGGATVNVHGASRPDEWLDSSRCCLSKQLVYQWLSHFGQICPMRKRTSCNKAYRGYKLSLSSPPPPPISKISWRNLIARAAKEESISLHPPFGLMMGKREMLGDWTLCGSLKFLIK